jgi:hypothetical protein
MDLNKIRNAGLVLGSRQFLLHIVSVPQKKAHSKTGQKLLRNSHIIFLIKVRDFHCSL